jgi:dsDNA-specific endonuclease/ATPase MutS2
MNAEKNHDYDPDPVKLPIDGILDLHTFNPRDIKDLIPTYLEECRAREILEVRIIHGKGTGTLQRIVHSALEKHPAVASFQLGGHVSGGWGATLVNLKPVKRC